MQIIKTHHYSYQRNEDIYSLTNLDDIRINYTLTRLKTVGENIVAENVIVEVGETKIIVLPTEWHYALKVTYYISNITTSSEEVAVSGNKILYSINKTKNSVNIINNSTNLLGSLANSIGKTDAVNTIISSTNIIADSVNEITVALNEIINVIGITDLTTQITDSVTQITNATGTIVNIANSIDIATSTDVIMGLTNDMVDATDVITNSTDTITSVTNQIINSADPAARTIPVTEVYHIAYFPTVKQQLINNLKKYICKNSTEVQLCVNGSKNIREKDINETNLLFNSMQSYLTLLTSQSLLRDYQTTLTKGMFLDMNVTIGLLQTYYDILFITSDIPKSGELLRFYLVLYYTLFLLIELDISLVVITDEISTTNYVPYNELLSPPITDSNDLTAVKELFDYPNVKDCIMSMNIDFITLYSNMVSYYLNSNNEINNNFINNVLGISIYYGTPGAVLFTG